MMVSEFVSRATVRMQGPALVRDLAKVRNLVDEFSKLSLPSTEIERLNTSVSLLNLVIEEFAGFVLRNSNE